MKKATPVLLIILLILISTPFTLPLKLSTQVKGEYSNDRIVIGFKIKISGDFEAKIREYGGSVLSKNDKINFITVSTPEPDRFIAAIKNLQEVMYAERDGVVYALDYTPNDTYYSSQWGPQDIYAPAAWDTTKGSGSVTVAIIDTGVLYTHPDLQSNIWTASDGTHGYDFVNSDNNPIDDNGHGTHCSGIVAAVINNGLGVAGISQSSIMAVKVLNSAGNGYNSWIANGITWAVDHGANIISMSLGSTSRSTAVQNAVSYAYSHNCLLVAAAGNAGNEKPVSYPAMFDQVIAVSALVQGDTLASYSSTGSKVELSAPGSNILSTYINNGSPAYAYASGTSMACPHVAGVAALVLAVKPSLSNVDLRNILGTTAVDLGPAGRDSSFGYGKVNSEAAVQNALPVITFTTSGMGSDAIGAVMNIDSTAYTYTQIQSLTFSWTPGSTHTVIATDPVSASPGKRYMWTSWTNGDGLSGTAPSTYTVPTSSQTVTANYKTQYYLTVNNGGHGTSGGEGWYDANTNTQATITPITVSGTTGTQYVFTGWGGEASGTGSPSDNILMDGPKIATANWKIQYQVAFAVNPVGAGTSNPSTTYWYDDGATMSLSATPNVGYTFSSWSSTPPDTITFSGNTATVQGTGTITAIFVPGSTMYVGVQGGGNSLWWSTVDTGAKTQSDWNILTGSSPSSPSIYVSGSTMYVCVQGDDNSLWWSTVDTGSKAQSSWSSLTGSYPSSPSIYVSGSIMYIGVRGGSDSLWWCTVDTGTKDQSDWHLLTGSSPSSPSIFVYGSTLYMAVKGGGDSLWWTSVDTGSKAQSSWNMLTGSSPSSPSIYVSGSTMYIGVRGGGDSLWWCTVDTGSKAQSSWNNLTGSSPSAPSIFVSETRMYFGVRGGGDSLWWSTVDIDIKVQSEWNLLTGSSPSSPSIK